MPRGPRLVQPHIPHHIVLRGNNRRRIFSYAPDYRYFLHLLKTAAFQFDCKVHAWCLMANHVHIVVTPDHRETLSRFVKRFAQVYAQQRNRRFGGSGKLFEQRYWSKPSTSDLQLAMTIAYVELNPIRANLVTAPEEYAWSSFRERMVEGPPAFPGLWQPSVWYRTLGRTPQGRLEAYVEWLRQCENLKKHADVAADALRSAASRRVKNVLRPDGSRAA